MLIRTATNSFIYFVFWNVSKLNFEKIPDLEGFKPFFDRFELTPSFALDTTGHRSSKSDPRERCGRGIDSWGEWN
ncbi:MAG TPA: hypothetical protein VNS33_07020, partial [Bradyrhizobium sp.]|nr:hypothetical protein [Bradyrhizobium sp.]